MKSNKTKCLIISTLALLFVGNFYTQSYALSKPSLDTNKEIKNERFNNLIKKVSFSNNIVGVGDTLKISIEPKLENNNIEKMILFYNINGKLQSSIKLSYNPTSKKFEADLNITKDLEQSTLNFFDLTLIDTNGNNIHGTFDEKLVWVKDKNGEVDKIAPEIKNITIDKSVAFLGEKVTISAEASDNKSGIKQFLIYYNTKTGNIFNTVELKYNSSTKKFEGTINVVNGMLDNTVFLDSFSITDNQGNNTYDTVATVGDSSFFVLSENNTGWNNINSEWIYLNNNKTLHKGWLKDTNNWYYLDSNSGIMQIGWKKISGNDYYFNESGAMESNKWINDYYVGESGATYYNQWAGNYYCGTNGKYVKNQWVGDYYCDNTGKYVKNKWIGDYYCDNTGKYIKNSWVKTNEKWYYCSNTGQYLKNTSINLSNKTYKFDANGVCLNP